MISTTVCQAVLCVLPALPPANPPDEGYDLVVLEMPHRAVLGGALKFKVRSRPHNPYVVLGDAGRRLLVFGNVWIHLDLGPHLFVAESGLLPPNGVSPEHTLPLPNLPFLDGSTIYFQAFAVDTAALRGLAASDGKSVTVHKEEGQPLVTLLTVNEIPRDQNAAEQDEGVLTVLPTGFTVDVAFDDRGVGAIDPGSLLVTADKALGNGSIPPNSNLARFLTFSSDHGKASGLVTPAWAFPLDQTVTLTTSIKNQNGATSQQERYAVRCQNWQPWNRPFATKQIWWLDFDRHDLDNSGVRDFREDLVLFGLGNDARATSGPSFHVDQWARGEIQTTLRSHFKAGQPDGVNVDFVLQNPGGTFATICIGGRNTWPANQLPPGAKETTGAAFLNPHNRNKTIINCLGFVGVHPRSIYHLFKDVPEFQVVFAPLLRNPVGADPEDPVVTAPGFDPNRGTVRQRQRYAEIKAGVDAFAKSVAFILVQETCHSMGLVPQGKPSGLGLLGGYWFGHSTDGHFDDGQGNFMSGNNSTPAPALPANLAMIWGYFQQGGHFTKLNWAYLRETLINM